MSILNPEKVLKISLCNSMTTKRRSLLDCRNAAAVSSKYMSSIYVQSMLGYLSPRRLEQNVSAAHWSVFGSKHGGVLAPPIRRNMAAVNRTTHSGI